MTSSLRFTTTELNKMKSAVRSARRYTVARSNATTVDIDTEADRCKKILTEMQAFKAGSPYREITDDSNGQLFAEVYKDRLVYVATQGWLKLQDGRFVPGSIDFEARAFARAVHALSQKYVSDTTKFKSLDAEYRKEYRRRQNRMLTAGYYRTLALSAQVFLTRQPKDFDYNLNLLNCKNGVIDLETCELRKPYYGDYMTKMANVTYDPEADTTLWDKQIKIITNGDAELAEYMQLKCGESLSGYSHNEEFYYLYGPTTRNGKGTLLNAMLAVFGDYGVSINTRILTLKRNEGTGHEATPGLAKLAGKRLVVASEPKTGQPLDTDLLKSLSGNDLISARFLNKDEFEFTLQGHIYIAANRMAKVTDDTIFSSRRCCVLPFEKHFGEDEIDEDIKSYFCDTEEGKSQVLKWLVDGFKKAKATDFRSEKPAAVKNAINRYFRGEEYVSQEEDFFKTALRRSDESIYLTEILKVYQKWTENAGCKGLGRNMLYAALEEVGGEIEETKNRGKRLKNHTFDPETLKNLDLVYRNGKITRAY